MENALINTGRNFPVYSSIAVLLIGCTTIEDISDNANLQTQPTTTEKQNIPCGVYAISTGGDSIGTAFTVVEGKTRYFLTASHVVRGLDERRLSLTSNCSNERVNIDRVLYTPSLDLAILIVNHNPQTPGFRIATQLPNWGDQLLLPGYPNVATSSVRFSNQLVPAEGRFISLDGKLILMTVDIVHKGSSGTPILAANGEVVGILTNRLLSEGIYAGLSYGVNFNAIRAAIRALPNSAP